LKKTRLKRTARGDPRHWRWVGKFVCRQSGQGPASIYGKSENKREGQRERKGVGVKGVSQRRKKESLRASICSLGIFYATWSRGGAKGALTKRNDQCETADDKSKHSGNKVSRSKDVEEGLIELA